MERPHIREYQNPVADDGWESQFDCRLYQTLAPLAKVAHQNRTALVAVVIVSEMVLSVLSTNNGLLRLNSRHNCYDDHRLGIWRYIAHCDIYTLG